LTPGREAALTPGREAAAPPGAGWRPPGRCRLSLPRWP